MKIEYLLAGMLALMAAVCAVAEEAETPSPADEEGFERIFNGEDLTGWDGDPRLWSVRDGAIRGQTTEENPAHGNTFLVWRDGKLRDFILKIKFRIQNGNSGIQYRSKEFQKWRISGYQAEVENKPGKVGFLYHERGRGWLVNVGDFMVIDEEGNKNVVANVSDVNALKEAGYYANKEWNEYTIIARGNHLLHYLNGHPTMALIDNDRLTDPDDPKDRAGAAREGLLALQIHAGPPMVVEFKDIRVKHLKPNYGRAVRLFKTENLGCLAPYAEAAEGIFANFTLHMQVKHLEAGSTGLLLRKTGADKQAIEVECTAGPGDHPVGQWNDYDITLDGGRLQVRVNNVLQDVRTGLPETPGQICLRGGGAPTEFRNNVLIPIEPEESGFKPVDFSTWETEGNWKVDEDAVLTLEPRPGDRGWKRFEDYIWAPRKYGDFAIDLEFRIPPGGNSGVFFRVGDQQNAVATGIEAQILDTHGKENPGPHDSGGVIGTVGPSKNMAKPAGEWNHMVVTCRGSRMQIELNGEQVVDVDLSETSRADRPSVGYLGFQDEAKKVEYRNVRIKELQ